MRAPLAILALALGAALLAGCHDDANAPSDGGPAALAACLDAPSALPQPSTALPCELLPPGFGH